MRKKIVIFGHYGVPNWGDEAILSGVLSQIDFTKYSVTVISDQPKWTEKMHQKTCKISAVLPPPFGVRSFFRGAFSFGQGFFKTKKVIQESDFVIFGGGGLFQDRPKKAIQIWNFYLRLCQFYGKNVFLAGNSFEKLTEKKNAEKTQKLFKNIPFFSVRDEASAEHLHKQFGVPLLKISQSSDGAYFLPRKSKSGRKKGVLLAIREGEISEKKEKKLLKILRENFPQEAEENTIEVLVMQEKKSGDKNFALRHLLPFFEPENLEHLHEKLRSSKFVLTSRLHAGILANLAGTPFVAVSTRDKISQFFGEDFSFSLQKIFTKKGEKSFREVLKNYRDLRNPQRNFLTKQQQKLTSFFPDFF